MRIDTDDIERARSRKKVGRKHLHQPRGRAIERRKQGLRMRLTQIAAAKKKLALKIAAYWRNEIENWPGLPPKS